METRQHSLQVVVSIDFISQLDAKSFITRTAAHTRGIIRARALVSIPRIKGDKKKKKKKKKHKLL